MCWFSLVRNIWGFLAAHMLQLLLMRISWNKPYFFLCLLANLAYILRPVDTRLVILGIFTIVIPHEMAPHWSRWMIFEQSKLLVNLMCFEIPWKLDFWSLQRLTLPLWTDFLVWILAHELEFWWYLPWYLELTKYPWVKYSLVLHFLRCIAQYLSNLGGGCLPSWMELWNIHHQTPYEP